MSAVAPGRFAIADFVSPFLLVLLAFLVRAPFFDEPPGRDQGLFMTQAWQGLAGSELYSEIWEHKPGGIVALYGLAIDIGGLRPASIQFLHGFAGAWTAVALFFVARRAGLLAVPATLAGIFYLVFFAGYEAIAGALQRRGAQAMGRSHERAHSHPIPVGLVWLQPRQLDLVDPRPAVASGATARCEAAERFGEPPLHRRIRSAGGLPEDPGRCGLDVL